MEKSIRIKSGGDLLEIILQRYSHPGSLDTYDKNWVDTTINIQAGGFKGSYFSFFQTTDFLSLRDSLKILYDDLWYTFHFTTIEGQLSLRFKGDGIGHIEIDGEAQDKAGTGNILSFELLVDQTQLPIIINEVNNALEQYPFQ